MAVVVSTMMFSEQILWTGYGNTNRYQSNDGRGPTESLKVCKSKSVSDKAPKHLSTIWSVPKSRTAHWVEIDGRITGPARIPMNGKISRCSVLTPTPVVVGCQDG